MSREFIQDDMDLLVAALVGTATLPFLMPGGRIERSCAVPALKPYRWEGDKGRITSRRSGTLVVIFGWTRKTAPCCDYWDTGVHNVGASVSEIGIVAVHLAL